ncbi:MAG: metallophosphoesterase [Gemmataceae bacterium]|nr:metallophosphoesterase [Gemmataceae bacterium]
MTPPKQTVRLAAMADIHLDKASSGSLQSVVAKVADEADVLLLCGDLTNYGLPEEAQQFVRELTGVKVPVVAVLGNHDFESHKQEEVRQILTDGGMTLLDGEACEIHGIGFAGVKGFGGGFDQRMLTPWGEPIMKGFVREAIDETLKLESALAKLRTPQRIALLHYAPIRATVENEPLEIFPFLGSSRLAEPVDRYGVTAVFHGHAHHGTLCGRTRGNVPVYNVALPLLRQTFPDKTPFYVLSVPVTPEAPT